MTKEEINETIFSLQSEEEIVEFVKRRIQELEDSSVEKTVGQGYTTAFSDYISNKVHYKPAAKEKDRECPDLVYDDITPYINLVKDIKISDFYSELTLFSTIFYTVYDYLPSDDFGFARAFTYLSKERDRVSIKEIRDNECAFCSEKSGMAHNMFKFLGVDSEVVCGYRDSERHAYNIVYPYGYGTEPMIIYDPSFHVNFYKDGKKNSFGYFKAMRREDYDKLMAGIPVKMDLTRTEKNYRDLYRLGDEYIFEGDTPSYTAGLEEEKENPGTNLIDDLYYSTHFENGVESVSNK